jgi:pimeloyl-ACP methyl ester carboxylesterase
MMRRFYRAIVLLSLLALAGCGGLAAATEQGDRPALAPCQLGAPGLAEYLPAQCTTLTVFEDHAAQSGRTIGLRIAVVPAVNRSPAPDPLFFLAGGPGQAASESYPLLAPALAEINQQRDIVLVDQRGTGGSHPLRCQQNTDWAQTPSDEEASAFLRDCLAGLDADPTLYTTSQAIDDLDQARAALGYEQINLLGVSYGTRAALTYMRRYPERVRTAILDGVVPQDEALGSDVARDAQRAIDLIFERCAAEAACAKAFPSLRAEFAALLEQVERQPSKLSLAHPITGQPTELTFDRSMLNIGVRLFSYAPETAALLPLLIHNAATTGDRKLLAAQALLLSDQLGESISSGVNLSVLCAEDVPFFDAEQLRAANAGAYLGDSELENLARACATWPRGQIPADFKQPVASSAPVLLLSGEADPVTPPENAEQAARTLPNSLQLLAPGQGHNVIMRGCLPHVAAIFVTGGTTAGLDTACVADIRPMPFFIDFSGPMP